MKKFTFWMLLSFLLFTFGCGSKDNMDDEIEDIDITDNNINIDVCNKYFELVECIIDNTDNKNWTPKMKSELKLEMRAQQEDWINLEEEQLINKCSEMLSTLQMTATDLVDLGCSV